MGCDIHLVIETKAPDGEWVGTWNSGGPWVDKYDPHTRAHPFIVLGERDYAFFGAVAGVRIDGPKPLGMPEDASPLARTCALAWDGDGHSHSYMPMREFIAAKLQGDNRVAEAMRQRIDGKDPVIEFLATAFYDPQEHIDGSRVVFWFDN